jgi:WhiB family redox-sensing transcriptional regulator
MRFSGALCVGQDLSLYYPKKGVRSPAVEICVACPAKDKCLDHGLKHEEFGIWGGTSPLQRKKMRKILGIELIDPMTLSISVPDHPFCGTEYGYQRAHRLARKGYPSVKCIACRDAHRIRWNVKGQLA